MEYQKVINLLGNIPDKVPRFFTEKWIEVHDQSGKTYNTNKQIRFKTSMLRSDLCDYNDAYIVVKRIVTVSADERDRDEMNRQVILLLCGIITGINELMRQMIIMAQTKI